MTCKFLIDSKFPLKVSIRIIFTIEFRYSEFNLRERIILVTYHTTRSSLVTMVLSVMLGVATIISVTLYLTMLLGQLLKLCHDGVEAGVGGGLGGFLIPRAPYRLQFVLFQADQGARW